MAEIVISALLFGGGVWVTLEGARLRIADHPDFFPTFLIAAGGVFLYCGLVT